MRDEDEIQKISNRLWELFEKYRMDDDAQWVADLYKNQFDVLEWVLENNEAGDVFDEEVLE